MIKPGRRFFRPPEFAFTLTELLVAIAIILIISSLLFPALSTAFARSRRLACLNNTRQIILAWRQWGQNRSSGSIAGESSGICLRAQNNQGQTWVEVLAGNISPETFKCPEQANAAPDAYGYGLNPLCGGVWYYNSGGIRAGFLLTPERKEIALYNSIVEPARTAVLCDSGYITDASIKLAPANWEEDGSRPWRPYVAFSLTGPAPYAGYKAPAYGYDWGNASPLSGVGEMGWDPHYRAIPRHPKVSTGFADGHANNLEIELLTEPEWGTPDCLYDNQPHNPGN